MAGGLHEEPEVRRHSAERAPEAPRWGGKVVKMDRRVPSRKAYLELAKLYRHEAMGIRGVERPMYFQKERWARMLEDAAKDYEATAEEMTSVEVPSLS